MAHHHHLLLLLLLVSFSFSLADDDDSAVMIKFSKSISNPPSTWKTEKHFCNWEGITCDNSSSTRVTSINLSHKSLNGTLPSDLHKLSHLKSLHLQSNLFYGPLPTLANLTLLQQVDLFNNRFASIPLDFFSGLTSLQHFNISSNGNYLEPWVLPGDLAQCTDLLSFIASYASITGSVPADFFSSSPNLRDLILSDNNINGGLPSHLSNLSQLRTLDLSGNSLSGRLPTLANLTLLETVDLSGNMFTSVPSDVFQGLINLQQFQMYSNSLLAPWILSNDLTQCTKLQKFDARHSNIIGPIPDTFSHLSNLQYLRLSRNKLNGSLPDTFSHLSNLQFLDLSKNKLDGHLPDTFSHLSNLQYLDLSKNKLDGHLPDTFSHLSNLQYLDLSVNNLSGSLPSHLNNLSKLNTIYLFDNSFFGALPTLANLSLLRTVSLENNMFTSIPLDLFLGLTSLLEFSISNNSYLEPWVLPNDLKDSTNLRSFNADKANIMGSIPDIFNSSRNLLYLYLSYNNLTGTLPASFGKSSIIKLWLDNQLQGLSGTLDVISVMTRLTEARLEVNNFSGPIPDLSSCYALGNLQLGDNQLTGLVPNSLTNLPNLASITLQNNRLQGSLPVFRENVRSRIDNNSFCLPVAGECDRQVTALLEVARDLGNPMSLAESWIGNDVCEGWKFITCDSSGKNVTVVNFGKQNFSGTISSSFAKLSRLRNLLLNENNLTGSIPQNLMSLADLQLLNASNNNLSGSIPKFLQKVKFLHNNNPLLGKHSSSRNIRSLRVVISSVIVSVFASAGIVLLAFYKCYGVSRKSHIQVSENHGEIPVSGSGNLTISIQLLEKVTDSFSDENVLGRGGFGIVYKGELHDGTMIAVKRMQSDAKGNQGMKEFHAEIEVLTKVRHRHLVALLGFCISGKERLLVYEYMTQGTLSQHLFQWREHKSPPLSWKQRVSIALDVGRGVEYLHRLAQQSFIHRDLKPGNILLDDDMRAKVADFGLVKNALNGKYSVETRLAGTFGYLAPEYASTWRVTTKVDVYAFGVVLMQLITGRKALDGSMSDERYSLVTWFRKVPVCKENMLRFRDQALDTDDSETLESILVVAKLACHCTASQPFQRPDMGYVVGVLAHLVEEWKPSQHEEDKTYSHRHHKSLPECLLEDDDTYSRTLNVFRQNTF